MNHPDWRGFSLEEGVRLEPTAERERIVLWRPTDRDANFQYWERIANVPRGDIATRSGLCTTSATSIRARQVAGSIVGRLWNRLKGAGRARSFSLPGGGSAEQCGERQNDLILVWSSEPEDVLDQERVKSLWPEARQIQQLGANLFMVSGLQPTMGKSEVMQAPGPSPAADNPLAHAEALLVAARQSGARDREATALTDLGTIVLNQGKAKEAIESFEQALTITRELGDTAREGDVSGNLGMAMLAVRQPERARSLFDRSLAIARATSDPFAEKVALERLAIASWSTRDFNGAIGLLDQSLALARQLGDRQQQAHLLWHLAIQFAELGQRDRAIANAEQSIALFKSMERPQAASYGAYLQKYRMGQIEQSSTTPATGQSPEAYLGGSIVASVMAGQSIATMPSAGPAGGPGLLQMAMSATKALAGFAGSGFKTAPAELRQKRLQTCASCDHHTGVRCRICGCFTSAKTRLLHEDCPIGKWPR